jgi:hypothetical protein
MTQKTALSIVKIDLDFCLCFCVILERSEESRSYSDSAGGHEGVLADQFFLRTLPEAGILRFALE